MSRSQHFLASILAAGLAYAPQDWLSSTPVSPGAEE